MPEATTAPDALCCPISMEIMQDPVISADGHTYERAEIKRSGAPTRPDQDRDRSGVIAPDPAHDPTATTSKFWGVNWHKAGRRWEACYRDANGKRRGLGLFDTQEAAAHAVNAAIRRAGLEGRRKTNPVVDGQLVPPKRNPASGHGRRHERHRDEPAATPSQRARRR